MWGGWTLALPFSDSAVLPGELRPAQRCGRHASTSSLPGPRGGVAWCGVSLGPAFIHKPALGIELLAFRTVTPEYSWLTGSLLPFVSCPTREVSPGRAAPRRERRCSAFRDRSAAHPTASRAGRECSQTLPASGDSSPQRRQAQAQWCFLREARSPDFST